MIQVSLMNSGGDMEQEASTCRYIEFSVVMMYCSDEHELCT